MKHSKILAKFLQYYPNYIPGVTHWRPSGNDSIYITFDDDTEMVFTYRNEDSWFLKPARKNLERGFL